MSPYFLLLSFIIFIHVKGLQIFNLRNCNSTLVAINLDLYTSVVINATYTNSIIGSFGCRLVFSKKDFPKQHLVIMNLQLFDIRSLSLTKIHAKLYFSTFNTVLFEINLQEIDARIRNMFLTRLLSRKQFRWNENLYVDLKMWTPSVVSFVLVITPARYCVSSTAQEMFKCDEEYYGNKICIDSQHKCNGWLNCVNGNNDESVMTCQSRFVYHILLPSVILSCSVFIMGWVLLKMTPCLLYQRRLFVLRRNRMLVGNIGDAYTAFSSSPFFQDLGLTNQTSETNMTPDNIPQSPPKYQNIYQKDIGEHILPPSYSEESDVGVIPEFFKRFFGKPRLILSDGSAQLNVTKDPYRPMKILSSQSDSNGDYNFSLSKIEHLETSTINSETFTSVTFADIFWQIPSISNIKDQKSNIPHSLSD